MFKKLRVNNLYFTPYSPKYISIIIYWYFIWNKSQIGIIDGIRQKEKIWKQLKIGST